MDEDTQDAAWAQQEQDERRHREDALLKQHREKFGSFRAECDTFHADFQRFTHNLNRNCK
jgi:hypothetical protein